MHMTDWGYQYTAFMLGSNDAYTISSSVTAATAFNDNLPLPPIDTNQPRACSDNWPVMAAVFDMGTVQPGTWTYRYQVTIEDGINIAFSEYKRLSFALINLEIF